MPNEALKQAMSEHSAYLTRYSSASINKMLKLLERSEERIAIELLAILQSLTPAERELFRIGRYTGKRGNKIRRLERIREQIQEMGTEYRNIVNSVIREDGAALVASEMAFTKELVSGLIVTSEIGTGLSVNQVMSAAVRNPMNGRILREMVSKIERDTRLTVLHAVRDGFAIGESTPETVRRLVGTKKASYKDGKLFADGELKLGKRAATALVRTSYTHFAAHAHLETYKQMGLDRATFTATIDGRTSFYCSSHDQEIHEISDPKKPNIPGHVNCRSVWVAYLGEEFEPKGFRPFVKSDKSVSQLTRDVKSGKITQAQKDKMIGRTKATNNFEDILRGDDAFAREYLGSKRYKLWKNGLDFKKFSDPLGRNYSIADIEVKNRALFRRLGLSTQKAAA